MITIELEIWDYIDGNGTAQQRQAVEAKIASDPVYHSLYKELLNINAEMAGMDLEEPSMSFTRNVMEQVKQEIAPVSLKTKVDKRIIYSISAFFIFAILGIVGYILASSDFAFQSFKFSNLQPSWSIDFNKYISPTFIKIFIFIDMILAFAYLDSFLRRKRSH